jgi:hypothetical protein
MVLRAIVVRPILVRIVSIAADNGWGLVDESSSFSRAATMNRAKSTRRVMWL